MCFQHWASAGDLRPTLTMQAPRGPALFLTGSGDLRCDVSVNGQESSPVLPTAPAFPYNRGVTEGFLVRGQAFWKQLAGVWGRRSKVSQYFHNWPSWTS